MTVKPDPGAADYEMLPVFGSLFPGMGVDGVYARNGVCQEILDRIDSYISRDRHAGVEILRFPPVMSRQQLLKSGYLKSFPNLLGCVCSLQGSDAAIQAVVARHDSGADWTTSLAASDLVLSPAACYPVYPLAASRGLIPPEGLEFDVSAECFRREPSSSMDRMQSFRMREFVRIGSAVDVKAFRQQWIARAEIFARSLGLPYTIEVASDPFFGWIGQIMALSQTQQSLKFELLVRFHSTMKPTACMSFNYHLDHFGAAWGLKDVEGNVVHTACVAFGMDRLVTAMFCVHGPDVSAWPAAIRSTLRL